MTNKITRRALGAGLAAVVMASPKANAETLERKLDVLEADMADRTGLEAMEVTGNSFAPVYRAGDIIVIRRDDKRAGSDVAFKTKGRQWQIGQLVHHDESNAYVRGFKASDRLQGIPWKQVATMGRIVITSRA